VTVSTLITRSLERLNEDPDSPVYYTSADILAALNLAQRLYAFLTLCLEVQRQFPLTPGNQWYQLQQSFTDMIVVLRCEWQSPAVTGTDSTFGQPTVGDPLFNGQAVTTAAFSTSKLQPGALHQFAALNNAWYGTTGMPERYNVMGFGLLVFDKQPDDEYTAMVTYARMPVALVNNTDSPEIPEPDHQCLVDFAVGFPRIREGGQELQAEAPSLQGFLSAVQKRATQMRMRSLAQRYDRQPPEITMPDLSRLLRARPDLNAKKEARWTSQQ
jgi:hypothetical protein